MDAGLNANYQFPPQAGKRKQPEANRKGSAGYYSYIAYYFSLPEKTPRGKWPYSPQSLTRGASPLPIIVYVEKIF
jgi:hypothetical protein